MMIVILVSGNFLFINNNVKFYEKIIGEEKKKTKEDSVCEKYVHCSCFLTK